MTFPFAKKALPAPPPAAPPPIVAAPPPPPPPVLAPVASASYVARDIAFYAYASALLASALQPPGYHVADHEQANTTGDLLARLLDSGAMPKGCVINSRVPVRAKVDGKRHLGEGAPEPTPTLDIVAQKEALEAQRAGKGVAGARFPPTMTAAQQVEQETRLQWAGGDKIPTRKELEDAAATAGESLADISEGVRYAALVMSYGRILLRSDITGAPHRIQDAVDIVVSEIDRARVMYAARGLPVAALRSEEEAAEQGPVAFPYPVSLGIEILGMAFGNMPDLTDLESRIASLEDRLAKQAVPAASEDMA